MQQVIGLYIVAIFTSFSKYRGSNHDFKKNRDFSLDKTKQMMTPCTRQFTSKNTYVERKINLTFQYYKINNHVEWMVFSFGNYLAQKHPYNGKRGKEFCAPWNFGGNNRQKPKNTKRPPPHTPDRQFLYLLK